MALGASEFRPRLDSYNGPLDLLLFLIKKDEVDIFDIPIARVVEQYGLYLRILQQLDPNACGDFLVLLAQLIEIKSKLILPRPSELEDDEEYDDPRLELVQQLLEFKKYKERAMLLEERLEEFNRRYRRVPGVIPEPEPDFSLPLDLGGVSVWDLLTAFHRVQLALGTRGPHRVVLRDRPIGEFIEIVEGILSSMPGCATAFSDLFVGVTDRYDAIGILLAVLEMAKQYRLEIRLEEPDGAEAADGVLATSFESSRFKGTDLEDASFEDTGSFAAGGDVRRLGQEIRVRLRSADETERLGLEAEEATDSQGTDEPAAAQLLRGEGEDARAEPIEEHGAEEGTRSGEDGPAS